MQQLKFAPFPKIVNCLTFSSESLKVNATVYAKESLSHVRVCEDGRWPMAMYASFELDLSKLPLNSDLPAGPLLHKDCPRRPNSLAQLCWKCRRTGNVFDHAEFLSFLYKYFLQVGLLTGFTVISIIEIFHHLILLFSNLWRK